MIKNIITKTLSVFVVFIFLVSTAGPSWASFTIKDEKELGSKFYKNMQEKSTFVKNKAVNDYINSIGRRLLSYKSDSLFDFTFSVIENSAINAFATPGGYVYIYSGLIELTENESQLAGVIAHEIAHIEARHIAQTIEKSQKINIAALAAILAGAFIGGSGEGTAAITSFSMATATSLSLKYSRENEEEADRMGMQYMANAGYDCTGMLNFLKIMRRYEFYSNTVPSYFLSHPGTNERISYLDGLINVRHISGGKESIVGNLDRVKAILILDEENLKSSLEYFQNELKENPEDTYALYGLAVVQGKLGHTEESFKNFRKALTLSPGDEIILRDFGIAYFNAGRIEDAIGVLKKAYLANETDAETATYLGRSYEAVEDYRSALDIYKKYHEENPDDVETYYHLGMAYGKTGNSGESHCNFGTFFKKQNKPERALFHLEAALGYFPQNSKRAEEIKKEMDLIKKQKDRRKPSPPDRADGNGNAKRPYYPHHSIFRQP